MMPPELAAKMVEWRAKATAGTITLDEMKQAIIALRGTRRSALEASSSPSKAKKPSKSADDMLAELGSL